MKTLSIFLFLFYLFLVPIKNHASPDTLPGKRQNVSILFYNVENLYDPYDDTATLDDEFTKSGAKSYSWTRFRAKLSNLAKTLITACGNDTLAFIGLCEVENRYVLNKLIYETPLKRYGYRIIHRDSPDLRGVDVAALYQPEKMKVVSFRYIPVRFPRDTTIRTRDVLYVKAVVFGGDTLHLFVNHWPSRRGGQEASAWRRNFVAQKIHNLIDSIIIDNGKLKIENPASGIQYPASGFRHPCLAGRQAASNILLMGDFNDEPADSSLAVHLEAFCARSDSGLLFNMMGLKNLKWTEGTIRYRGRWSTFDQFIVSRPMLEGSAGLFTSPEAVTICRFPFLLEEDPTWFGEKLSRTYSGPRYLGGFSDHLPVMILILEK